jgi:hypothetical protein
VNEKQQRLIMKIKEKTESGAVVWEEGVARDTFQVSFEKYTVRLQKTSGRNFVSYDVSIIDSNGRTIDTFGASNDGGRTISESDCLDELTELFKLARRSAFQPEKAIDDILAALG